jgi:hypothetical protein
MLRVIQAAFLEIPNYAILSTASPSVIDILYNDCTSATPFRVGCILALRRKVCIKPSATSPIPSRCIAEFDQYIGQSQVFKSLASICAPWKKGLNSNECVNAINTFSHDWRFIDGETYPLRAKHAQMAMNFAFSGL